jgi:integrase
MSKLIERRHPTLPYVVRWYKPKQGQRSFATREEAEAFMPEAERIEAGEGGETFREYATRWNQQTSILKTARTVTGHDVTLRLHLFPAIGDVPLTRITHEMCKDLLLSSGKSPAVVSRMRITLCAVLNEAVRDERISKNPAKGIKIPAMVQRAELVPVTYAQLTVVERELPAEWRLALWLLYGCGLRLGEALAVRADSVREGGEVLRVDAQVINSHKAGADCIGPLKARKAGDFRDIPLPAWLLGKINDHTERFGTTGYLFPDFAHGVYPSRFRELFNRGRARAGVPELHPHALRHLWVSTLLAEGVPIDAVARFCGHRNVAVTFGTYGHLLPSSNARAREVSDRAWEGFTRS